MNAKDYLSQTWRINRMIDVKLEQVQSLRDLSTNASATLSNTPPSGTRNVHSMEDIIAKMLDLESEINSDISNLLDLKREIESLIRSLPDADCRALLELRYLCFKTWEEIAQHFHYTLRHIHRIHGEALAFCNEHLKDVTIIC